MNAPARRRVPKPSTGGAQAGRGGGLTQAAEQFAGALAKPPTELNLLKNFDESLGDLAGAVAAIESGMKNYTAAAEAGMPAEVHAHQELGRYAQQFRQMAEGLRILQADQRRRNALDHERIDNGRPNEDGYDHRANNNR